MLRPLRELALVLGLAFAAALLSQHLAGASAHRAFTIVFYLGGAGMLVFTLVPRGVRGRGYGTMPLLRRFGGPEPRPRSIRPASLPPQPSSFSPRRRLRHVPMTSDVGRSLEP
ncbi:MAG TPA: hypothetical protein VE596_06885 [Gaiellaceae bacterium]|nr:hypothetical protein [Gaiellaceae bacterium]